MRKYPSIRYPGEEEAEGTFAAGEVVVQEKIDGANFRFTLEENLDEQYHTEDREIAFGSRNVQFKNKKDENKQFKRPIEYIRETVDPDSIRALEEDNTRLTFFGEAMTPHTLEYNWEESPPFVGFDVWDEVSGRWLSYDDWDMCFKAYLGLDSAQVLDVVPVDEWDEYEVTVPESEYGEVKAEGLTFKNYDTQTFAKFVREDFKEKHKKTFGRPTSHEASGAEKLSYNYVTNARIKKNAHKLVDEGDWDSLQMEMMAPKNGHDGLPQAVIKDMAEEEAGNIFMEESFEVDIGEFRSTTSGRCASVLRNMINKEAVNNE